MWPEGRLLHAWHSGGARFLYYALRYTYSSAHTHTLPRWLQTTQTCCGTDPSPMRVRVVIAGVVFNVLLAASICTAQVCFWFG